MPIKTRQITVVFPATGVTLRSQPLNLNDEFITAIEIPSVAALTPTKDVALSKFRTAFGAKIIEYSNSSSIYLQLSESTGELIYRTLPATVFASFPNSLSIELSASDVTNPITVVFTVAQRP